MRLTLSIFLAMQAALVGAGALGAGSAVSFEQAMGSKLDLWGEEAMRQPNGASYEFFEKLLPPPRYVNADFRFYPILLSGPRTTLKARLISNGSGINVRGGTLSWNDPGTAVIFRVGPDELRFGEFLGRLQHPTLAEGYLPITEIQYTHDTQVYRLEAFGSTDPALASNAVVFIRFSLVSGSDNVISVEPDSRGTVEFKDFRVQDQQGKVLAYFDENWTWKGRMAHCRIGTNHAATLAVATKPLADGEGLRLVKGPGRAAGAAGSNITMVNYATQREQCAATWEGILAKGMSVEVPEPYVNRAWRQMIVQNFQLMNGNRMHYSAGNQYDKLYEAEGSDAAIAMLLWGYQDAVKALIPPLLDFTRKGLEFHQAGHKLDDICQYYWQTRDAEFIQAMQPRWRQEVERIAISRTNEHGLFPKEQYCGDIATPVYSLNSNAKCWAALRDLAPVLQEIGESAEALRVSKMAEEFRRSIALALDQSIRRETEPPFVPIALFGEETPHDPITHSRMGGYWDLMANYIIGTRVLGKERENWLPHYLETHGGLCMGMTRTGGEVKTFWTGIPRTNPLYGLRYALDTLRRDDPERALVNFYGMLAHGFTRNTFVGAEGCCLTPLDEGGRIFYCPPNSASNAEWLSVLRHLLVQDLDLDDDGKPETLRLLFGTPRRWLEDGKAIKVERAPTAFGPVSLRIQSRLNQGEVVCEVDMPGRNPARRTLMRLRLPEGWRAMSARAGDTDLALEPDGTVDLSGLKGRVTLRLTVTR
jgi:hypothetical protein